MATTQKAVAMARDLADNLRKRLSALALTESQATDGNPLINVGTGLAGAANVLLKVRPIDWPLGTDVVGLAQTVYTPHVIQMVTETAPTSLTSAHLLAALGESLAKGARLEWYQSANGVAPTTAAILAANLKGTYESLYWPMVSSS